MRGSVKKKSIIRITTLWMNSEFTSYVQFEMSIGIVYFLLQGKQTFLKKYMYLIIVISLQNQK